MKACTFKVGSESHGMSYGELLLKTLFKECEANDTDYVYCTVFKKQGELIDFLKDFGFHPMPTSTESGELVLFKSRRPPLIYSDDPLKLHVEYGPPLVSDRAPVFLVPIVPRWHELLFPDVSLIDSSQTALPGLEAVPRPYGNALRKAYVCASQNNQVEPGAVLAFYRSHDSRSVHIIGVVEQVFHSKNADEILQRVGRRTVYRPDDIVKMLKDHQQLHVMLFRQDRQLKPVWSFAQLKDAGVLGGPPQSITQVKQEAGLTWIRQQLTG